MFLFDVDAFIIYKIKISEKWCENAYQYCSTDISATTATILCLFLLNIFCLVTYSVTVIVTSALLTVFSASDTSSVTFISPAFSKVCIDLTLR